MPEEKPDFSEILKALDAAQVRYVLIGGLAMVAHGSSHVTVDIDISYSRDIANLQALANVLRGHHPQLRDAPPGLPFIMDARTLQSAFNLTLDTDLGDIDLLSEPPGVSSFEGLWERSIAMEFFGVSVHVASLSDLISMKEAANRPKDRNHLLELRALQKVAEGENRI